MLNINSSEGQNGESGDVTMSEGPACEVKDHPKVNVAPPSDGKTISLSNSALKELEDDSFIEAILADNNSDKTTSQKLVENSFMKNFGKLDSMVTQTLDGSHTIGDFNMVESQLKLSQSNFGEVEKDPFSGPNASKKKGRPLGSKNKKKEEILTPITGPLMHSSS